MGKVLVPIVLLLLIAAIAVVTLVMSSALFRPAKGIKPDIQPIQKQANYLLPDIRALNPKQLFIDSSAGERKIRFSTTFVNIGEGPLELLATQDTSENLIHARQRIRQENGLPKEQEIGSFVRHPTHGHWHIENYVTFELWSLRDNKQKGELLKSTDKMSFCIWDEEAYDLSLPNASQAQIYTGCNNERQGISVGWSDTYAAATEGQELTIEGIADGRYLVVTHINPDQKIAESNYQNNESWLVIEIVGQVLVPGEELQ